MIIIRNTAGIIAGQFRWRFCCCRVRQEKFFWNDHWVDWGGGGGVVTGKDLRRLSKRNVLPRLIPCGGKQGYHRKSHIFWLSWKILKKRGLYFNLIGLIFARPKFKRSSIFSVRFSMQRKTWTRRHLLIRVNCSDYALNASGFVTGI